MITCKSKVWRAVPLGECCDIVSGSTPKTKVDRYWDGDIFWATPKDLSVNTSKFIDSTERCITREGLESCSSCLLPANSILLSSRAPIGYVAINRVPMATNQGFKSLVPKDKELFPDFLYWWLKSQTRQLNALGRGATFKEISKREVARVKIPLPPLEEQRRIAEILDLADGLRAKRREALAEVEELTQAVFLEMFGDPVNQTHFPSKSLLKVCKAKSGGTPSRKNEAYWGDSVPWFSPKDLKSDVVLDSQEHLTERGLQESKLTLFPKGTVVIVVRGMILAHTFPVCQLGQNGTINQDVKALLPEDSILPIFLANSLRAASRRALGLVSTSAHGTKRLDTNAMGEILVPTPPVTMQRQFAERVEAIENLKASHQRSLEEVDALFASLQSRAFKGEL